jgi:hypothetical protein
MRKLSILLGAILLAFACSLLLVSSTLFFLGVPISWFNVPVAAAMAGGFGWWGVNFYFPHERIRVFGLVFGSAVIAFFLFALLSSRIHDISWDGQTYHTEGIVQLANGWNPFFEAPRGGPAFSHSGVYAGPFYLIFSSKGAWICAAALYKFSGSFEAGKAFHPMLILACFLVSFAAFSTFRNIKSSWILVLSLLLAFNPVSICQMHTYYVDGQLSSLLAIAVGIFILIYRRPDRFKMAVLALVAILTINVKLNGALYMAILGGGCWLFYVVAKKTRRAELAAWLMAGGILGGGFVGFSPYITQFTDKLITTGNPFYPYAGWTSVVGISSPEIFGNKMDRVSMLAVSLFSKSEVRLIPFKLKLPFTFSLDELQAFAFPDVRVGGFGPLFSGAKVISIAILGVLCWKNPWRLVGAAHLLVLMSLIFISALSLLENWNARFAPQVWMLPLITAILALLISRRGVSRGLAFALLLLLFTNNLLISYKYTVFTLSYSELAASQLETLKKKEQPIPAKFGFFNAIRYRFDREGIRYVEVETLPCAKDKQKKVILSQVSICVPEKMP